MEEFKKKNLYKEMCTWCILRTWPENTILHWSGQGMKNDIMRY